MDTFEFNILAVQIPTSHILSFEFVLINLNK